jgi:hypothetical protein
MKNRKSFWTLWVVLFLANVILMAGCAPKTPVIRYVPPQEGTSYFPPHDAMAADE